MQTAVSACLAVAGRYWSSRRGLERDDRARRPAAKPDQFCRDQFCPDQFCPDQFCPDQFCPGQVPAGSVCTMPPITPACRDEGAPRLSGGLHAGGERESLTAGTSRPGPGRPYRCG